MTFKKLIGLSMIMILAFSLATMTSCSKKEGCTNQYSDNYDSEAEEDDGSCVAWSEKFVGSYEVTLSCGILTPLNSSFDMTISKTGDVTVSMILTTETFGAIPLNGTVENDQLTFTEFSLIDQEIPVTGTPIVIASLTINGSATMGSDNNLSGTITINTITNVGPIDDSCPMVAIRK